jgi:hypothetical protein
MHGEQYLMPSASIRYARRRVDTATDQAINVYGYRSTTESLPTGTRTPHL